MISWVCFLGCTSTSHSSSMRALHFYYVRQTLGDIARKSNHNVNRNFSFKGTISKQQTNSREREGYSEVGVLLV